MKKSKALRSHFSFFLPDPDINLDEREIEKIIEDPDFIDPETEDIFLNRTNKEEIDFQEISEEVEDRLSKMYWYDRKIFELVYVKKISRLQLAEMTGISYHSIKRTVRKVKNLIKTIK